MRAATLGARTPPPEVDQRAIRLLLALQNEDTVTATLQSAASDALEWHETENGTYWPVVLMHDGEGGAVTTGVAILLMPPRAVLTMPHGLIVEVSLELARS